MKYSKFLLFNIIGGVLWTALLTFAGFFFGNIPFVKNNLSVIIIAVVVISFIPVIIGLLRKKR
jgi:membrane-associated protein